MLFTLHLISAVIIAQGQSIAISKTNSDIKIDGKLTESDWRGQPMAKDFVMNFPQDSTLAKSKTEVWMTYNEKYLYVAAKCHEVIEDTYVVQSLKRDFSFQNNDAFGIYLDPFQNANSGYGFIVNPFGVQLDGIVGRGGTKGLTTSWDGLWHAEVFRAREENYWTVEIAIPLKTLRFNNNTEDWKINFSRNDLKTNETSTWSPVPIDFDVATQSYMGNLKLINFDYVQRSNMTIVPFSVMKITKDHEDPNAETEVTPSVGVDAKIEVSPSLNLDLTINPDFSQVEVDEQILDLNRFELFFPERRLFFLENSNQFSGLGNSRVMPFFSRRIGGVGDEPVSILFGARLSGNINETLKVGLMNVQTAGRSELDIESQNWTVASLQQEISPGFNVAAFVTNRQAFIDVSTNGADFNRVGGVELDYISKDSKTTVKGFAHYSRTQDKLDRAGAYTLKARYRNSIFSVFGGVDAVGENYITDMGYVPRLLREYKDSTFRVPYIQFRTNGYYRFYMNENRLIHYISPKFNFDVFTDNHGNFQEHTLVFSLITKFMNRSELALTWSDFTNNLIFPFELTGLKIPIQPGRYRNQNVGLEFTTNKTQNLYGELNLEYGGQYMGRNVKLVSELNYRFNKFMTLGLNYDQRFLMDYPIEYGDARFTLLGSKVEFSFSKSLFFSTFLQYNTQKENFNINSRLNWRFRPLSDLFLVYTENYTSSDLSVKDKTLVLKFSYWFNL